MSSLKFSSVSIVESLKPNEKKTGKIIYDHLDMLETFHRKGLGIEYVEISTRPQLENHIELLTKNAVEFNDYPILQIEAHGTDDKHCLALNSGESIDWFDLEESLRTLNIATKGNLLVVMSTCFGAFSSSIISLTDRAPFWGIIGPEYAVYPEEIVGSLTSFYTHFYQGEDSGDLLQALEFNNERILKFITAEWLFVKAYIHYVKNYCNDAASENAANVFVEKQIAKGLTSLPDIEHIKTAMRPNGEEFFSILIRNFFMVDQFPENEAKISVQYDQIPI